MTIARLLYDFALAEGDRRLADLILARGSAAFSMPIRRSAFTERAIERIARRLGLRASHG
jgi:hypothetical protein